MIEITYKKKQLQISQIWFPKKNELVGLGKKKSDILFLHGVNRNDVKERFNYANEFHTCMNYLEEDEADLLAKINKNVRYEIRRNEKEEMEVCFYSASDILKDEKILEIFAQIYEKMYLAKGMEQQLNLTAIKEYLKKDTIFFTAVKYNAEIAIFHAYICDGEDTRLWYSASCFRDETVDQNMIGRANKRLHWEDMKFFKNKGYKRYDWGGISDFENPNGIDAFKLKFGGEKITYDNVYVGITILGKIAVFLMKLLKK